MANCHDLFSLFHEQILLSETKKESLRQSRDAIRERIKKKFTDAGRSPVPRFSAQGSYMMHTIVNPLDGEYDIDDGVYLQNLNKTDKKDWPAPETAHKWIYDAVDGHTNQRPIDKRTCVRVIYAGQYHLDLPIYAELTGEILHAEIGKEGWHKSDPQALTDWFQEAASRHTDQLRRMVRYFKAWADYKPKDGKLPSGLILTVLITEKLIANDRDDVCFGRLAKDLYLRMISFPYVRNPVDPTEDFYSRYSEDQKTRFIEALRHLRDAAANALATENKKDACRNWRSEFGDRWTNCDKLEDEDKPRYTKAPAILRDDARSA